MATDSSDSLIVVIEPKPYWGPELRRQFQYSSITIREVRSIDDVRTLIVDFESVLLVVDLDAAMDDLLNWLSSPKNRPHRWPIIACGSPATSDLEWLLRDAGVTAFLPEVIAGDMFARLCRRQLGIVRRSKAVG